MLDDFDGSQAHGRRGLQRRPEPAAPLARRPGARAAVWAENIPFTETRDYVKKVLSNATIYAALLSGEPPALRARLGRAIGPRDASAPAVEKDLP